jgi:hypothetical protein
VAPLRNFRLALATLIIVAIIVGLRAVIFAVGFPGLSPTALVSSIIGGGIFVMGLVIAGTLSDYKDAERAPTDLDAGLYAILRETESMNRVWGKPRHAPHAGTACRGRRWLATRHRRR